MDELTKRLTDLGAPDPAGWAASEIRENIAQQARFIFLRKIWPEDIDGWARADIIGRIPAGARLIDAGARLEDLTLLVRAIAYETAFSVINRIDEGYDPGAPPDAPGWILMETDANGKPTGRDVGGLHEDLLMLDPTGREGSDLRR